MIMKYKRSYLPLRGFIVALLAVSTTAFAGASEQRISQLERVSSAQAQVLATLQQQINAVQQDIDEFRGQMQMAQYQLDKLSERQRTLAQQFAELSASQPTNDSNTQATPKAADSNGQQVSGSNEAQDYQIAINYVMQEKNNDKGLEAFKAFVSNYPNSKQAANANYWLGQLYYQKGQKTDAKRYFAIVVKNYANSPKASDALFKIGVIMQDNQEIDNARKIYNKVILDYANSTSAKLAQQRLAAL